jgi:hypothetical protein
VIQTTLAELPLIAARIVEPFVFGFDPPKGLRDVLGLVPIHNVKRCRNVGWGDDVFVPVFPEPSTDNDKLVVICTRLLRLPILAERPA